jgi:hypothetical protein
VEDNLAALRLLEEEAQIQDEAVKAAQQSIEVTTNQYRAGIVSYLNVVTAQTIALTNAEDRRRHPRPPHDRQRAAGQGSGRRLAHLRASRRDEPEGEMKDSTEGGMMAVLGNSQGRTLPSSPGRPRR